MKQIYKIIDKMERQEAMENGVTVLVSVDNTANPPTLAQIQTAFGEQSTGFVGLINDAGAGVNEYLCWHDGTNWFYVTGTKAT